MALFIKHQYSQEGNILSQRCPHINGVSKYIRYFIPVHILVKFYSILTYYYSRTGLKSLH